MNQTDQRAYWLWQYRKKEAKRKGLPFTEPKPVSTAKLTSAPKAPPRFIDQKPCRTKALLWKKRSLEIKRELLSKSVFYDGFEADVAANNQQLRDVHDLLRQAAA
ncbi:MAG TPA: hypothetical protein VNV63_05875 [Nitrospiria bacterium]|jgi:hypothetical protein|nr:hypothetical protein [Nitrospiria bacterium]